MTAAGPTAKPTRAHCSKCGSRALAWEAVSGRGRVHTFTVAHRAPHRNSPASFPLSLQSSNWRGPQPVTNLVDCDRGKIEVGAAIEVRLEAIDVSLPVLTHST